MCDSPDVSSDYIEEKSEEDDDEVYEYVVYTCNNCGFSWEDDV